MSLLRAIFIWWQDQTIGTWFHTLRRGSKVGTDDDGNTYYEDRKTGRRWVIYDGDIEASRVPPEWHRWLHYTTDVPPSEAPPLVKAWEKPHVPNLTGSVAAYVPPGSLSDSRERARATGDYEAWQPE